MLRVSGMPRPVRPVHVVARPRYRLEFSKRHSSVDKVDKVDSVDRVDVTGRFVLGRRDMFLWLAERALRALRVHVPGLRDFAPGNRAKRLAADKRATSVLATSSPWG